MRKTVWICLALILFCCLFSCSSQKASQPSADSDRFLNSQRARAALLIEEGNFPQARAILEEVNSQMPGDAWTLGMLALAQWKTGALGEATANFEESLRRNYNDYLTHLRFANMLSEMGKTGRALTEYELAMKYGENESLAHYNYGLALFKMKREQDALFEWQRAYDLDPSNPSYAEVLGIGLTGKDDQRAFAFFEEALALGQDTPSFHHNFALLLQRIGRFGRAERHFKDAIRIDPDNASYRFDLAAMHMNQGSYKKALEIWEALVEDFPDRPANRVYLARALLELERFDEAIVALRPFETESTNEPGSGQKPGGKRDSNALKLDEIFGILALSYRGKGELEKANLFIEKALDILPQSVEYLNNYGVILADRGMMDRAKIQWQKVLAIDPENKTAKQNLSAFDR
jgi:tetratricopeptide (TPR) repeat protein